MSVYVCPNQVKHNSHNFIMCRLLIGNVTQIQNTQDALMAYCPHQKYCSCSKGAENTEQARSCYLKKQSQTAVAD